jgi:hypothetical protein
MVMSYTITGSAPDTPWLIDMLLVLHDKHLAEWQAERATMYEPVPESAYCEWWNEDYSSVLTYEVTDEYMVNWTVAFGDEKEYIMFMLRWS